jgi:flagellar biosynthesis protein FliR
MPIKAEIGLDVLFGFLLTMARVSGAVILIPMPGYQGAPSAARVVLIVATTVCLFPFWPHVVFPDLAAGAFLLAILRETGFGLVLGLAISFLSESLQLAAQIISMQTGFSFASTFDPSSQADSGVFQVISQLAAGLFFFAFGIHRQLIRMFALSLSSINWDPSQLLASGVGTPPVAEVIRMGSTMFITALRLALPAVALLLLTDICLSMVSRLQAQVQMLMLAFPAKICLSLFFLSAIMVRWPAIYEQSATALLNRVFRLMMP